EPRARRAARVHLSARGRDARSARSAARRARGRSPAPASGRAQRTPAATPSAAWRVVNPGRRQRLHLQLLGELEGPSRHAPRRVPCLWRRREPKEEPAAEVVVIPLVRLDDVTIERGRRRVSRALAELDEL